MDHPAECWVFLKGPWEPQGGRCPRDRSDTVFAFWKKKGYICGVGDIGSFELRVNLLALSQTVSGD